MAKKKKKQTSGLRPTRNSLCPCGSGRAYKNCCAGKQQQPATPPKAAMRQRVILAAMAAVIVVGGILLFSFQPWQSSQGQGGEYDAENDRHWDPEHGHWHGGRPPGE